MLERFSACRTSPEASHADPEWFEDIGKDRCIHRRSGFHVHEQVAGVVIHPAHVHPGQAAQWSVDLRRMLRRKDTIHHGLYLLQLLREGPMAERAHAHRYQHHL